MAARKMIKVKEKWPLDLYLMTGQRKKAQQIKRCMIHIFEFYEETFPEHSIKSLQGNSSSASQQSSEKSERVVNYQVSSDKQVKLDI
jgi:hypothetical protein